MRATTARLALAAAAVLAAAVAAPRQARAAETRHDLETDHIDAFDDGGPRSFGLLANPLALAVGTLGVEGDLVLGDVGAMSLEGDLMSVGDTTAYGAAVGFPLYPWRLVFHGFYFHPRVTWVRATSASSPAASVDVVGGGATVGWQWTWRFGLTLRAGAGAAYAIALSDAAPNVAVAGLRPLLDGSVGWVF